MTRSEQLTNWVAIKYRNHPYFDHCLKVAQSAGPVVPLGYEVGLCHDMLEDGIVHVDELRQILTQLSYAEKEVRQTIATVQELTDVFTPNTFPELTKKQRRKQENSRLTGISSLAQTVKYADLIDGARWISENRPEKWERYQKRKCKLLLKLDQGDPGLRQIALQLFC